jgi:hypothetical protein
MLIFCRVIWVHPRSPAREYQRACTCYIHGVERRRERGTIVDVSADEKWQEKDPKRTTAKITWASENFYTIGSKELQESTRIHFKTIKRVLTIDFISQLPTIILREIIDVQGSW